CVKLVAEVPAISDDPVAHEAGALPVLDTSVYGPLGNPLPPSANPDQLRATCPALGVAASVPFVGAALSMRTSALFVGSTFPTLSVDWNRTYCWQVLPAAHATDTLVPLVAGAHVFVVSTQYTVLATPDP